MKRIALFSLAVLLAGCSRDPEAKAPPKQETRRPGMAYIPPDSPMMGQIRVEEVREMDVPVDEVDAPGKIEVNPNRVSRVVTPVAGRVTQVFVRVGDAVTEGQAVVTIESPDADQAISAYLQADASLGQMSANLLKAQADLDRVRDLLEHEAVAKKEVLNAENALVQAKAQVEQAQANKEQARRRLEILWLKPGEFGQRITLRAPVSGKVLELNTVPGEFRNDTNAPLATIADLSTVWIASDVPETSIRFIRMGERLELELAAFPGRRFFGNVTRIADTVDPQTRTIKVRAEIDNHGGELRPEMFGRIRHTEAIERLPAAPAAAILQEAERAVVWREVGPGTFSKTAVETAGKTGEFIGIRRGLNAGDRIVVDGVTLLRAH
jgi:cobalt-zinc-cadmium efflux system membrane fusion protein